VNDAWINFYTMHEQYVKESRRKKNA
jgi:hypothetical protein